MLNHLMIDMLTTAKTPAIERLKYSSLFPIDPIPKSNSSFPGAIMVLLTTTLTSSCKRPSFHVRAQRFEGC